jgi:hypothetical protein
LTFTNPEANAFNTKFVICPPLGFFNNWNSPAMNQSSGSDTEDYTTVVIDNSSKEVGVSTYGTPLRYRDDPSSPSVTPLGYWEKIQLAGLKKRKCTTPKKSTQEI